jgi:hypothetical protein
VTTKTALACAAVVGSVAMLAAAETRPGAFGVAVLRRDGVLIPFAAFDGRHWRNAWPGPQTQVVVPITVASVPKRWWGPVGPLETWQAWVDAIGRVIHVTQPDWVGVHCARHLALRTDYATAGLIPPDGEQPYPKDGVAVSPPQPIERIQAIAPAAMELQPLAPVLLEAFNVAEREPAMRTNHPMPRRVRDQITPAIEAAYAFGDSPRFYYVEAMRMYRLLGQAPDECAASAFGTGWFVREGGAFRSLVTAVDLLPCNGFGASYMLPLGVMRTAGRLFWLAQFSGADHERYAVLDLTPKKVDVMISTWGGGC